MAAAREDIGGTLFANHSQVDNDDYTKFTTADTETETFSEVLAGFANIQPPSPPSKRSFCGRCRYPWVWDILHNPKTLLLYPCPGATDLANLHTPKGNGVPYNLIILDGTWSQVKGMYHQNPALHHVEKVQIMQGYKSRYVIRSQPTDACLSTLETAAIALSILEDKPTLEEVLTRPLVALCDFQLKHGAVPHDSKQRQIEKGTYTKSLPKSMLKRLVHEEAQLKDL